MLNTFQAHRLNLASSLRLNKGEEGQYQAFQNRCTHLGHRRLDYVPGTETVQCCSVNKSTYTFDGEKIHGPAPQPIPTYPVAVGEGELRMSIA